MIPLPGGVSLTVMYSGAMKQTPDFDSNLIRHDYKRTVYRAMLSELPPGEIIEFFHSAPLIVEGEQVKLNHKGPTVRIDKTGRGRFSLRVTGGLQYRESAPVVETAGGGT